MRRAIKITKTTLAVVLVMFICAMVLHQNKYDEHIPGFALPAVKTACTAAGDYVSQMKNLFKSDDTDGDTCTYSGNRSFIEVPKVTDSPDCAWGDSYIGHPVYEYGRMLLNSEEKSVYKQIRDAVISIDDKITLKTTVQPDRVENIYSYFNNDHVECGYLTRVNIQHTQKGKSFTYILKFEYLSQNKAEIKSLQLAMANTINVYIGGIKENSTDYSAEKSFHDMLIKSGNNGRLITMAGITSFNIDYASAMKLFLNAVGVKAIVVSGMYNNIQHLWNMVEIGGDWYQLDASLDFYAGSKTGKTVTYNRFNFTINDAYVANKFDSWKIGDSKTHNYEKMPEIYKGIT